MCPCSTVFFPYKISPTDLQHRISLTLLHGRLCLAPVDRPRKVLDLGSGSGLWTVDFARQWPDAEVIGIDLHQTPPPDNPPPNVKFLVADCEDTWAFGPPFDYVHGRYISLYIRDHASLIRAIYHNLTPGGHVEFMEALLHWQAVDDSLDGTAIKKWNELLVGGVTNMGRDVRSGLAYKRYLKDAGFVNVTEKKLFVPTTPWPRARDKKMLGAMQQANLASSIPAITTAVFTNSLGWSHDDTQHLLSDVLRDARDTGIHAYNTMFVLSLFFSSTSGRGGGRGGDILLTLKGID